GAGLRTGTAGAEGGAAGTTTPNSSPAGQVAARAPRLARKPATTGHGRNRPTKILTNAARCCVISPDCIHNVDNSQAPASLQARIEACAPAPPAGARRRQGRTQYVIRIGVAAWRLAPRPQRLLNRRTTVATSSSGKPTGQTAAAAARSGVSPSTSEDASPSRE